MEDKHGIIISNLEERDGEGADTMSRSGLLEEITTKWELEKDKEGDAEAFMKQESINDEDRIIFALGGNILCKYSFKTKEEAKAYWLENSVTMGMIINDLIHETK